MHSSLSNLPTETIFDICTSFLTLEETINSVTPLSRHFYNATDGNHLFWKHMCTHVKRYCTAEWREETYASRKNKQHGCASDRDLWKHTLIGFYKRDRTTPTYKLATKIFDLLMPNQTRNLDALLALLKEYKASHTNNIVRKSLGLFIPTIPSHHHQSGKKAAALSYRRTVLHLVIQVCCCGNGNGNDNNQGDASMKHMEEYLKFHCESMMMMQPTTTQVVVDNNNNNNGGGGGGATIALSSSSSSSMPPPLPQLEDLGFPLLLRRITTGTCQAHHQPCPHPLFWASELRGSSSSSSSDATQQQQQQLELYRLLIRYGINVNARDSKGRTILMVMMHYPSASPVSVFQFWVDAGVDLCARDNQGRNFLHHIAAFSSSLEVLEAALRVCEERGLVDLLVKKGVDSKGFTPFFLGLKLNTQIFDRCAFVKAFHDYGVDVCAPNPADNNYNMLHYHVLLTHSLGLSSDAEPVAPPECITPNIINAVDSNGNTALHLVLLKLAETPPAACFTDSDVQSLHEYLGVFDPTLRNQYNQSYLEAAASVGQFSLIEFLIYKCHCDINEPLDPARTGSETLLDAIYRQRRTPHDFREIIARLEALGARRSLPLDTLYMMETQNNPIAIPPRTISCWRLETFYLNFHFKINTPRSMQWFVDTAYTDPAIFAALQSWDYPPFQALVRLVSVPRRCYKLYDDVAATFEVLMKGSLESLERTTAVIMRVCNNNYHDQVREMVRRSVSHHLLLIINKRDNRGGGDWQQQQQQQHLDSQTSRSGSGSGSNNSRNNSNTDNSSNDDEKRLHDDITWRSFVSQFRCSRFVSLANNEDSSSSSNSTPHALQLQRQYWADYLVFAHPLHDLLSSSARAVLLS